MMTAVRLKKNRIRWRKRRKTIASRPILLKRSSSLAPKTGGIQPQKEEDIRGGSLLGG